MVFKTGSLTTCAVLLGAMASMHSAHADSSKLRWEQNGHDYQFFSSNGRTWAEARQACEDLGGYLATITSDEERTFIEQSLSAYGYIGGLKPLDGEVWGWVTGEKFEYTYWASGQPGDFAGYLAIDYGQWVNVSGNDPWSYTCEFAPKAYIDTTQLPPIDVGMAPWQVGLYVNTADGKVWLDIRDSASGSRVKAIKFKNPSVVPPLGVAGVPDLDGDSSSDLAVLFSGQPSGKPYVQIYSAQSGALLKSITYLSKSIHPVALSPSADLDLDGKAELTVLGVDVNTDKAKAETRSLVSGAVLGSVSY